MNLSGTQLKDTYGNLVTIGSVAGSPTTGTLQNGAGNNLTDITIQGTSDATLIIDSDRSDIILSEDDTTDNNTLIRQQSSLFRIDTLADNLTSITRRFTLDHSSGDISFRDTSDNEAFYWDASAGSLGIGTSSPSAKLEVYSSTLNNQLYLVSADTGQSAINFGGTSAKTKGRISYSDNSDLMYFFTDSQERLRIDSSGNLDMSAGGGNIILDSGAGIDFSDTANSSGTMTSELLDDYEEGTWTPTLEGSTTAGTYTFSTSLSHYTKIGRQVTVTSRLVVDTASGGVGTAKFGGLPFTKLSNSVFYGSVRLTGVDVDNSTINISAVTWTLGASTEFYLSSTLDNASTSNLDIAGISTGDIIEFSFTYIV